MHELSLCESIANTVREHAHGREARTVYIRIGHFRQVVPETLRFCWDLVVEGSPLDGCELVVEHVPATVSCNDCGASTSLTRPLLRCDSCGGLSVVLVSGDEFLVESIDLVSAKAMGR